MHKSPGETNFFNEPGTWDYLERLKGIAVKHHLIIFPEVHAEYGKGLHEKVAGYGYPMYDFFLPGLLIDALDRGTDAHLRRWFEDIQTNGPETINMLGCHNDIPMRDLRGVAIADCYHPGLLGDVTDNR